MAQHTPTKLSRQSKLSPLYCAVSMALLPTSYIVSTPVQAEQSIKQYYFHVEAAPMAKALRNFASQAGISISFDDKIVSQIKTQGIQGNYAIEQGLTQLLINSQLSYRASNNNAYIIEQANINTLATAQVTDTPLGNKTQGTNAYTTGRMNSATGLNISLRETPQSVSVITTQLMEDLDIRNLTDVVHSATGISSQALDSERQVYAARGFSIDSYQIDGNSITWGPAWSAGENQTNTIIFDRVEIIRGANGLMVGAGNPSASINMVRKRADNEELTGTVNLSAGSWNNYSANVDVGSALNENGSIRARVVASYQQGDYFVDLATTETSVLYGVVDFDLTDNTQLSIGASYQDNSPTGTLWGGLPIWYDDNSRTNYERSKTKSANWSSWQSNNTSYFATLSHQFANSWQVVVNANHIENEADEKLLWITGRPNKETGEGMYAYPSYLKGERVQDNFSLTLGGDYDLFGRQHSAAFGYNYSNQDHTSTSEDNDIEIIIPDFDLWDGSMAEPEPEWGQFSTPDKMNVKETGFYGVTRLSLTDELKVIAGARFSDWHQQGNDWTGDINFGDTAFIPYAGVLYDLTVNHTLYASFTDIFQPQDNQDKNGKYLDPIRGSNYELGLKSAFFDETLTTSLIIFKIDQDNVAQAHIGETVPGTTPPAQAYYAAQGTVSEGFEIEAVGALSDNWHVTFGYTQFKAEDAQGNRVNSNQPRKLFKLFSKYNFTGKLADLSIGGGINWQGETSSTIAWGADAGKTASQGSYTLVNLMGRYDITKQLSAQVNITNLLDETYYSQIGFYGQLAYGEPRNLSLNLKYNF